MARLDISSQRHAVEVLDLAYDLVSACRSGIHLLHSLVNLRRLLKIRFLTGSLARRGQNSYRRPAIRRQKFRCALGFACILFLRYHTLTGPQTLFHLAVDATGVLRVRSKNLGTPSNLEQTEQFLLVSLG